MQHFYSLPRLMDAGNEKEEKHDIMDAEMLKTEVRAAKRGDAAAFGRLYAEFASELYRFALWYLRNEADAEDAVQNAMLSAWANVRRLKKEASFRAWLFQILANACKTLLRQRSAAGNVIPFEESPAAELTVSPAFEDDAVGSLLGSLKEEDRVIVTMAVLGRFTSAEIGAALGMKNATVRSRLSRALHTLREELETEGVAP